MKTILTILAFLVFSVAFAQKDSLSREASYALFAGLVGTWETKGNWKNGSPYHQQMVVDKELTGNIFKAKTQDFVDSRQFDDSRRNFGVRAWDKQEMKMKFWEFDVFGGITKGEVVFEGKNIYFVYDYPDKQGKARKMADAWIFVDRNTYQFAIAEYKDGKLGPPFMAATWVRK